MEKKYKIFVPKGNPDDGFKKREVQTVVIGHPLEKDVTLMGYRDKHKGGRFVIVELTTGRVVAMGNSRIAADISLTINYKTLEEFNVVTKKWVDKYGTFNEPLIDPFMPSKEALAGITPLWARTDKFMKELGFHVDDNKDPDAH